MNYRHRYLETKIEKYKDLFPVLLIVGARQVGKSTLLDYLLGKLVKKIIFDPTIDIENARSDPEFFLKQHPAPLILDEIQYAPELLAVIKRHVDNNPAPGQYFLTGSQNLNMIKNVAESLAGRVIVLNLATMSLVERAGLAPPLKPSWLEIILSAKTKMPDLAALKRVEEFVKTDSIFSLLWRGGFPKTLDLANDVLPDFFKSYIQTYVERDIRVFADVHDQQIFSRFLGLCAALTAQEINYSQLGRELGITPQTALRWLSILKATYQWLEIPAFSGNAIKRLAMKPKGYITDTGMACYLQRISSFDALGAHPLLGALFETHAVLDMHQQFTQLTTPPNCYHWRTQAGAEVDLILERDGIYWPVEIKCKTNVSKSDARGIEAFKATYPGLQIGPGIILAAVEKPTLLTENILILPFDLI